MRMRDLRRAAVLLAGAPPAAMLLASPFTAPGPAGVFQSDLVGLVLVTGLAAFLGRRGRATAYALAAAALLCALAHVLLAGDFGGAPAVGLLVLACGGCASGLAALGRALGAPWLTAGALMLSSCAARAKLSVRAAVSKTRSQFNEGMRRTAMELG